MKKYLKFLVVGSSCAAIGAGASAIASAGAASSTSHASKASATHKHHAGLFRRAVHADFVVHTKSGFVTVTLDRGFVESVSGQQLTIKEGTRTATYKTVTLTIPANARVRDNGHSATLADLKAGQHVLVVQGPKHTRVSAHDVHSS